MNTTEFGQECSNGKSCLNGGQGIWEPRLLLWAEGYNKNKHEPLEVVLIGLAYCDNCKQSVSVETVISDDGWKKIKVLFFELGNAQPDRDSALLNWGPITILGEKH